jgi:hypothetical protein
MDKRFTRRKSMRLAFTLEFISGMTAYGYTRNLSFDGALVECNGLAIPGRLLPKAGDPAVFSLTFKCANRMVTIRLSSRIVHIQNNTIGLQLFLAGALLAHKNLLTQLLNS